MRPLKAPQPGRVSAPLWGFLRLERRELCKNGMHLDAIVASEAREIFDLVKPDTTVMAIDKPQFLDWAQNN